MTGPTPSIALSKPWLPMEADIIAALPAQLGVYQIGVMGDDRVSVEVVRIGYAGGRSSFGLRSVLADESAAGTGDRFRYEVTHGYLTRWEELLMLHQTEHGCLPTANTDRLTPVGRLRPLG